MSQPRYLRAARLEAGVSLADMAEAIGITESAVSYIETGRSVPRIGTLHAYAVKAGLTNLADALAPVLADLTHGVANATGRRGAAQS